MNDDQIEAALRAGPPDEPRYHMAASAVRPRPRSRASIASVLAPVLTLAVVIVVVSTILRPRATDDAEVALPGDIQAAGVLRVGVSVEAPQLTGAGGTQGFDVDVAQEVGRRLGITVQVSAASLRQLLAEPDRWDLILATGPAGPDPDGLAAGEPYLWRSGALVRRSDDPILSLEDVAGQTACVPLGGAATTWLESRLPVDAVSEPSPELTVVTEPSLTACLDRIRAGSADVAVADWAYDVVALPPGLTVSDVRPFAVPAAARVADTGEHASAILAAVDDALEAMRRDGTLRDLSRHRFAGADYTSLP